jgi:hypothetical protein
MSCDGPCNRSPVPDVLLCAQPRGEGTVVGRTYRQRILVIWSLTLGVILSATTACDASSSSVQTTGPDCPAQLRYNGATYTAFQRYGFPHAQPTKFGSATPVCAGTTIGAGNPISVWSLPGAGPSKVIGRRVYPRRFVVYVADSVKRSVRARVLAAVTAAHSAVAAKPCGRVEFDHRTYLLTRRPHGAGPGVGRILGAGHAVDCHGATEAGVRIYSVNEEDPARAITISQDGNVWLYTRR